MKSFTFVLLSVCLLWSCSLCQPAFQRIVVKRPCRITSTDGNASIADDSLYTMEQTFDIYQRIDERIQERKVSGQEVYNFAYAKNKISGEYPVYANSDLGEITDLYENQHRFSFMNVAYVDRIDFDSGSISLVRVFTPGRIRLSIDFFQDNFIWYTELLDWTRVYMPIYGFLGINENPESYRTRNGYDIAHGSENQFINQEFAKQSFDYDFYRILDIKNEKMLIAGNIEEVNPWNSDGSQFINIRDMGVLGWIEEENMLIWRSRLYYHPLSNDLNYYSDVQCNNYDEIESNEISAMFYHSDPQDFDKDRFPFFKNPDLRTYYYHFGFPLLYPPTSQPHPHTTIGVGILPAIESIYIKELKKKAKSNIELQIIIDNSHSMSEYNYLVNHFVNNFFDGSKYDFSQLNCLSYYDSGNTPHTSDFTNEVINGENIRFGLEQNDNEYCEPILFALRKTLSRMESAYSPSDSTKFRLVFLIADAGPNCSSTNRQNWISDVCRIVRRLDVNLFLIRPSTWRTDTTLTDTDTPERAFNSLIDLFNELSNELNQYNTDTTIYIRDIEYSQEADHDVFETLVSDMDAKFKKVFGEATNHPEIDRYPLLLPKGLRNINFSSEDVHIIAHLKRFIRLDDEESGNLQRRIAIDLRLATLYANSELPFSPQLFNKMIAFNNFKRIHNLTNFNNEWEQLFELNSIHEFIGDNDFELQRRVYESLTNREVDNSVTFDAPPTVTVQGYSLETGLSSRRFVMNSSQERDAFIYLTEDEIIEQ